MRGAVDAAGACVALEDGERASDVGRLSHPQHASTMHANHATRWSMIPPIPTCNDGTRLAEPRTSHCGKHGPNERRSCPAEASIAQRAAGTAIA
jgi:hypothetical protein